jgi:flagellar motor switch protein FliN/FliY
MTEFTEANVEAVLAAGTANAVALAEGLGRICERPVRVSAGESGFWSSSEVPAEFQSPGILVVVQVGAQGLAVLVPMSLPLPDWCAQPDDRDPARLDALAAEWAAPLLPAGFEATRSRSQFVPDLADAVQERIPADWAAQLELDVSDAAAESGERLGKMLVVWPLTALGLDADPSPASVAISEAPILPQRSDPPRPAALAHVLGRLRHLPVPISVRLAEKKIPLSQLLSITPGMLIMFNKPCEDLLDLYVSNSRYCRGEAVKIGENFGLKVNQVGVVEEPPPRIIDA